MEKQNNRYASETVNKNLPEVIEKNLPEKLKAFRAISGLTTNEVGQILNKTPSTITMWEKGKSLPDISTLFKLRDIYNIADLNDFFDAKAPVNVKSLARSEQELIKLWRGTKPHVRAAVKTLLKECNKKGGIDT